MNGLRFSIPQVVIRNYKIVLILGFLTFLVAGPYVILTAKKSYAAVAELRIDPVLASAIPGNDGTSPLLSQFYNEYVVTQKFKILKSQNLEKALLRLPDEARAAIVPGGIVNQGVLGSFGSRLFVAPSDDSLILSVVMTGERPEGLAEFLNELVKVYLEELQNEKGVQETTKLEFTNKQKQQIEERIAYYEGEIRRISREVSTGNFSMDDTPYGTELKIQSEAMVRAENDRVLREKQYNEFLSQLPQLQATETDRLVEEIFRSDAILMEQKRQMTQELDRLNDQFARTPPENALRDEIKTMIVTQNDQMRTWERQAKEKLRAMATQEAQIKLENKKLELFREYSVAKKYEDAVKTSWRNIQSQYSTISKQILDAQTYQDNLAKLKDELGRINSSLYLLEGQRYSGGQITVENYARTPTSPESSTNMKNLIMVFALSFGWIVFLRLVMEVLDFRVKSSEELRLFTGIKPSWPLSHYPGSFRTVTIDDPGNTVSKAIESLATRINQERISHGAKTVTFCGIEGNSGTTETLLNCAHGMKKNCEKILVIDLNRETPGLAGKLEIPETAQVPPSDGKAMKKIPVFKDEARGLDVVTFQKPFALDNKTIDQILSELLPKYDMAFLDTGPVLKSAQTEHVFIHSDTVIFVVHGNKTKFPDVQHTLELAHKFNVKSLALLLNWWKNPTKEKSKKGPQFERVLSEA